MYRPVVGDPILTIRPATVRQEVGVFMSEVRLVVEYEKDTGSICYNNVNCERTAFIRFFEFQNFDIRVKSIGED